ncbi:hypothetical protein [Marinomonas flavescens]|uniref:hypothetical protein n=1 Tax=Marinomonas flavescens TaxID=2529379 RepID=UPI001055FCEE|nr:hypothetical protein [Marinomonas flavescens]
MSPYTSGHHHLDKPKLPIYHFFQSVIGVKREADLGLCVDREQGIVQASVFFQDDLRAARMP